jgi:hypothetical protein
MKLCFVSVNGPRETYFVDWPRTMQYTNLHMTMALCGQSVS